MKLARISWKAAGIFLLGVFGLLGCGKEPLDTPVGGIARPAYADGSYYDPGMEDGPIIVLKTQGDRQRVHLLAWCRGVAFTRSETVRPDLELASDHGRCRFHIRQKGSALLVVRKSEPERIYELAVFDLNGLGNELIRRHDLVSHADGQLGANRQIIVHYFKSIFGYELPAEIDSNENPVPRRPPTF